MKGLLLKDLYVMRSTIIVFSIIIAVLCIYPYYSIQVFGLLIASMIPMTLHSYDVRCKWHNIEKMMPYTTFKLVFSNYLAGYICLIGGSVIELIESVVLRSCMDYYKEKIEILVIFKLITVLFSASVVFLALLNPPLFIFKRTGYSVILAVFGGLYGFCVSFFQDKFPLVLKWISKTSLLKLGLIEISAIIPISVLSIFISCKLYIKGKNKA